MRVSDFDFDLPQDLLALRPAVPRQAARLLVVREGSLEFGEATLRDLPGLLNPGDLCIYNDTKVINAQLFGTRPARGEASAANIEVTLHKRLDAAHWAAFAKPGRKLKIGDTIEFARNFSAAVLSRGEGGEIRLAFSVSGPELDAAIARHGVMPLPPYIAGKRPADAVRAQAIGIGLYDGCSLRGSVRQPVKRTPVGGDGVKVDGKGRGCHVEPCFDRWAEDVKRKAGCAPKAAATAPERARHTRTALRSSAGAARRG